MGTPAVLVTTPWLLPGSDAERILTGAGFDVRYSTPAQRAATGTDLASLLADVDGLIAGTEPFGADVLGAGTRLKVVARTGVGYDNVDVEFASTRGIAVCATPGVNNRSVAEFTIALALNVARRIPENSAQVREGEWTQPAGRELHGKTLGVVGFGAIGRAVAELGSAFGMPVLVHDPYADPAALRPGIESSELEGLLRRSDVVTLHVPLTPETRHLIDAAALAMMKPDAFLINAARGGVVDEAALADALARRALAGAALDTFEEEPLSPSSPLRQCPNLLLTAHIGGATVEGRNRSGAMAAQSIVDVLQGRTPQHIVNGHVLGGTRPEPTGVSHD